MESKIFYSISPFGLNDNPLGSKPAILIMCQSADRQLVIPAWMPESSHKDVNPGVAIKPFSNAYATDMSPSLALDSGIHAGMTAMEP